MQKGFTLTEVIAVIVVLSVIILMAVPAYLGISETLRQRAYDNKVKQIETKAIEWAEDNNITENTTISLARLIDEGYIQMDDETSTDKRVINPLNNESMECYHIIITIENGSYKTKLEESEDCELKFLEEQDSNIKVVGYEIDANTHKILSNKVLEVNGGELEWSGKDILLVTTSEIYKNPESITFSTGSTNDKKSGSMYLGTPSENEEINPDNYQNTYIVSASLILRSKYSITYDMGSENPRKTVLVKIDKERPNGEVSMLEKWGTSENKKVKLSGSDGVGSGIKGYYINNSNNITSATYYEGEEVEVSLDIGTYYYWVEDKVGNRSEEGKKTEITNIDDQEPTCIYPENERSEWSRAAITIEWGCEDNESGCQKAKEKIEYKGQNQTVATVTIYDGNDYEDGVRGEYIYDVAGNKTFCPAKTVSVLYDTKAPTCTYSKGNLDTPNGVSISIECSDKDGSGVTVCGSANRTTYGESGVKSSKSYTMVDKAGNSTSCNIPVYSYYTYSQRTAITCTYNTDWNPCKTRYNNCTGAWEYKYNGYCDISGKGWSWTGCYYSSSSAALKAAKSMYGSSSECGTQVCDSHYNSCKTGCSTCGCTGGWNTATGPSGSNCGWNAWSGWGTGNNCGNSDTCETQSQIWYN